MTAKELAIALTGREVGWELFPGEERDAKDAGLVVVYGYSDDNVELRGAIDEEVGAVEIKTYPEMNETIKDLLRRSEEPMNLYIAARLEELEKQLAKAAEAPRSRFERIKACQTPTDMVLLLNGNERRFCPKAYVGAKPDECKEPCGRCIVQWLEEMAP